MNTNKALLAISLLISISSAASAADGMQVTKDIKYLGDKRTETMDMYRPEPPGETPMPAVIWIHGGGWAAGDKTDNRALDMAKTLVGEGYVVFSINYKLMEYKRDKNRKILYPVKVDAFPQNIHDCKTAIRFVRKNAKNYQVDPRRIALAGASAGGHLALITGMTSGTEMDEGGLYKEFRTDVCGIIDLYGPTDLQKFGSHMFHGETEYKARKYSPINYFSKKTPPLFITHGKMDPTVKFDDTLAFITALKEYETANSVTIEHEFVPLEKGVHSYSIIPSKANGNYDLRPAIKTSLKKIFDGKTLK